jgi:hyperosmotically inducible periplasmic protein
MGGCALTIEAAGAGGRAVYGTAPTEGATGGILQGRGIPRSTRVHAHSKDIHMRKKMALTCLVATTLMLPVLGHASDDQDSDRSHPKTFVKDSVITTKIKSKLAAEHPGSMARVHVDTDDHGVVWLSGHVRSQEQRDRAVAIAHETEGVTEVKNHLHIKKDD